VEVTHQIRRVVAEHFDHDPPADHCEASQHPPDYVPIGLRRRELGPKRVNRSLHERSILRIKGDLLDSSSRIEKYNFKHAVLSHREADVGRFIVQPVQLAARKPSASDR
jgi:hypothetical protein